MRNGARLVVTAGFLCLLHGAATAALAASLGVDARHGFDDQGGFAFNTKFETFRQTLRAEGHVLVPLDFFEDADLAGLDALILNQPYAQNAAGFLPSERSAIARFVQRGGGLMVHAEGGSGSDGMALEDLNALIDPYGVQYSPFPSDSSSHTVFEFVPHAITEGLNAIGVDFQRKLIRIDPPALDLTVLGDSDDCLAVVDGQGGAGTVVFLSDTSLWAESGSGSMTPISYEDNQLLLRNIVKVVTEPRCESSSTAGTVNAGLGSVRNVVFVNGSAGGSDRTVEYNVFLPFELEVRQPPAVPVSDRVPFALYAWLGNLPSVDPVVLPFGIGCIQLPIPMVGGEPQPDVIWNSAGRKNRLGDPTQAAGMAPTILVRRSNVLRRPTRFFVQGIIFDPGSAAEVPASVTNGILAVPDFTPQ